MRPISKSYTPAAADLNGFLTAATGATWTLTATTAGDSLGHLVTINNNTANSHAAKTAVLTGTDADGNVQTETMALPGASVATTSTKYFRTLLTIVPSATIGADTMGIGWGAVSVSQTFPTDCFAVVPATVQMGITGTINLDVQETLGNVFSVDTRPAALVWTGVASMTGLTANAAKPANYNVTAVRVKVNSVTAGATATIYVSQAPQR